MSTLISKASLLLVPSVYEDGTLYNVLPSGNKAPDETGNNNGYDQTRADFSFSRGSNLSATRIGSDGLIEKGRENLLLQSNAFDTTWNLQNLSVASGQSGYDGSSNAWKLTPSTSNTYHRLTNSVSGAANLVVTLSVYAKADGYNFLRVTENATTGDYATFNLSNGSVSNNTSLHATIENVGNGWYRCSSTIIPAASHRFDMYVMESATIQEPWAANGTDGVLIQNAQLEAGLVSTPYIATGSTTAQAGILEDMPRINYDANGENGALLLESSRTNLMPYSEYFGASDWAKLNTSVTTNEIASPEGVVNASKITTTSGGGSSNINDVLYKSANTNYTFSVFVKPGNVNRVVVGQQMTSLYSNNIFDFSTGTWVVTGSGSPTLSAENFGNGWYRLAVTMNSGASAANYQSWVGPIDNDGTTSNDTTTGNYIYTFGAQLEAGSYVSSIIPTHGAAVTRGADNSYTGTTSGIIGQTQGVVFCEFIYRAFAEDMRLGISDGTSANYNNIRITSGGTLYVLGAASSVLQYEINAGALTDGQTYKVALKYNTNDIEVFVNGVSKGTDTSATIGACNRFGFDNRSAGANPFYSDVKEAILFDTALTDAECVTLTTL